MLSFFVLLLFENSLSLTQSIDLRVVNCFHFSYFCSLKTALWSVLYVLASVVNCFHFSYFCSLKTAKKTISKEFAGCELLSFFVLLLFENSTSATRNYGNLVVNCFHFSYFCSLKTAQYTQSKEHQQFRSCF